MFEKKGNILDGQLAIYLIQLSAGLAGDEECTPRKFDITPEKRTILKGKDRLPTIIFQGLCYFVCVTGKKLIMLKHSSDSSFHDPKWPSENISGQIIAA